MNKKLYYEGISAAEQYTMQLEEAKMIKKMKEQKLKRLQKEEEEQRKKQEQLEEEKKKRMQEIEEAEQLKKKKQQEEEEKAKRMEEVEEAEQLKKKRSNSVLKDKVDDEKQKQASVKEKDKSQERDKSVERIQQIKDDPTHCMNIKTQNREQENYEVSAKGEANCKKMPLEIKESIKKIKEDKEKSFSKQQVTTPKAIKDKKVVEIEQNTGQILQQKNKSRDNSSTQKFPLQIESSEKREVQLKQEQQQTKRNSFLPPIQKSTNNKDIQATYRTRETYYLPISRTNSHSKYQDSDKPSPHIINKADNLTFQQNQLNTMNEQQDNRLNKSLSKLTNNNSFDSNNNSNNNNQKTCSETNRRNSSNKIINNNFILNNRSKDEQVFDKRLNSFSNQINASDNEIQQNEEGEGTLTEGGQGQYYSDSNLVFTPFESKPVKLSDYEEPSEIQNEPQRQENLGNKIKKSTSEQIKQRRQTGEKQQLNERENSQKNNKNDLSFEEERKREGSLNERKGVQKQNAKKLEPISIQKKELISHKSNNSSFSNSENQISLNEEEVEQNPHQVNKKNGNTTNGKKLNGNQQGSGDKIKSQQQKKLDNRQTFRKNNQTFSNDREGGEEDEQEQVFESHFQTFGVKQTNKLMLNEDERGRGKQEEEQSEGFPTIKSKKQRNDSLKKWNDTSYFGNDSLTTNQEKQNKIIEEDNLPKYYQKERKTLETNNEMVYLDSTLSQYNSRKKMRSLSSEDNDTNPIVNNKFDIKNQQYQENEEEEEQKSFEKYQQNEEITPKIRGIIMTVNFDEDEEVKRKLRLKKIKNLEMNNKKRLLELHQQQQQQQYEKQQQQQQFTNNQEVVCGNNQQNRDYSPSVFNQQRKGGEKNDKQPSQVTPKISYQKASNKLLISQAISKVCLAGPNNKEREQILKIIKESEKEHFIILFKGINGRQDFKGIYILETDSTEIHTISGMNASQPIISQEQVHEFYRFDTGAKEFKKILVKAFSIQVDAIILKK